MGQQPESLNLSPRIARDLSLAARGVGAVVTLLAEGNTVPFIARYRKEATGSLDEVQIRQIEERRAYLIELETRRAAILKAIDEQGKLDDSLRKAISGCETKVELEDLYLPYKKKRRTRAMIARERGLEGLAKQILAQPTQGDPKRAAQDFVDPTRDVPSIDDALAGARDIVAEVAAESAQVRRWVRDEMRNRGDLCSKKASKVGDQPTKYEQYYEHSEPVARVPSHRFLAMARGEKEDVLRVSIAIDTDAARKRVLAIVGGRLNSPFFSQMDQAVSDSLKRLILPSVENEVRTQLKLRSDEEAIDVFGENLSNLLLASPVGSKPILGIDPGLRTGCKCAMVDSTGRLMEHTTIYLTSGDAKLAAAQRTLTALVKKHGPFAIAVGNGTGGRETEKFCRKVLENESESPIVVSVSESGASVYSASDVARKEFPELDLTVRGAISIARRLQDPLAELVKLDPKVIGVGQYQHDVHQPTLQRKLDQVVESCVNRVGVELNTASEQLLAYVAGIGPGLAKRVIAHRQSAGRFTRRKELMKVAGLGAKTFEQAAGFLRVRESDDPLDKSAVHPERYGVVAQMAKDLGVPVAKLVGDAGLAKTIQTSRYVSEDLGGPTLKDIVAELEKPGRDPRETFEPPKFRDDVHTMDDLKVGMTLEGIVTNVTNFGAFVDIGVHQDGLVHISQLADRFIKHPSDVVKAGQKLSVRVLDVDVQRKRISLSAKKHAPNEEAKKTRSPQPDRGTGRNEKRNQSRSKPPKKGGRSPQKSGFANNPFAKLNKK